MTRNENELHASRILIVDDNIANIDMLESLLRLKGYNNVHTLLDSREAIDEIIKSKPDILLLDLMMPYVSGFDILEELQARGMMSGLMPVIVLTADATREAKQRALSGGANDFLTKPFDLVEAELRIRNLLVSAIRLGQISNQNILLEDKVIERTSELLEKNESIEKQNEVLRQIAWMQSHEVRAPLARLMGLISLLQMEDKPPVDEQEKIFGFIIDSAHELDGIIKDITDKAYEVKK